MLDYEPALPMRTESTLGAYLRRCRERSGLSVEAVSAGSRIEETLSPGTVREWRSTASFRVTLGNAGTVELELDGHALPALGERGQVVRDATIPAKGRP